MPKKKTKRKELEAELGSDVIFRDTFYNQEIINIAHEYIDGLMKQNLARAN